MKSTLAGRRTKAMCKTGGMEKARRSIPEEKSHKPLAKRGGKEYKFLSPLSAAK